MPPEPIALDSPDKDEKRYPLREHRRPPKRYADSDSEIDELECDADDEPIPATRPPPRRSPAQASRRTVTGTGEQPKKKSKAQKQKEKKDRKKTKKLQRATEAEAKETASSAARQNDSNTAPPSSAVTTSSATPALPASSTNLRSNGVETTRASQVVADTDDDDEPLGSLVVPSADRQSSQEPRSSGNAMSEDEVEAIASQPSQSQNLTSASARSSSVPIIVEPEATKPTPQRAASARPEDARNSGEASNPIQLPSSDAPLEPDVDADDDADVSDVSSITYSDSEEYEEGEEFFTDSEGSLHGSDSEDGLGSWTERDQDQWQGKTDRLDAAYDGNYEVRAVLRHRRNPRRGYVQYRVAWAGYPIYSCTWIPEAYFNSPKSLREYWNRQGGRPADMPVDLTEYSTHDSDTDVAVNRRPRQRAHEALKKRRREIRRDKVELRKYLASLDERRARQKAKEEAKYEGFRRAKHIELDTERIREKGLSRSYQKRLEKQKQKRWRRMGGSDAQDAAGPSRFGMTQANRSMADVSMKGRAGAGSSIISARTRVSQLDDSIPEDDTNQMVFRRSGPSTGPSFLGLSSTTTAPIHDGSTYQSGAVRAIAGPSSVSTAAGPSGSGANTQSSAARPVPGSYKGAHRRDPKVQIKDDFGSFLNRLHSGGTGARDRQSNVSSAQPLQAPTDADERPFTAKRRPSEVKKSNLLVLGPVQEFKGGSRPAAPAAVPHTSLSASSEGEDNDAFGIPEMSAVRSRFNPHQPAPDSDTEKQSNLKIRAAEGGKAPLKRSNLAPARLSRADSSGGRVEDPRRRARFIPEDPREAAHAAEEGQWSAQEYSSASWDTAPANGHSPVLSTPRSPLEADPHGRGQGAPQAKPPKRIISKGWFSFVAGRNQIEFEGALWGSDSLSTERMQALGLANAVGPELRFDKVLPFAWIRDILAMHNAAVDDAMLLGAHGPDANRDMSSIDQLSEQLKLSDLALLAYAGTPLVDQDSDGKTRQEYFVAFSSKYDSDYISGVPPAFRHICGHQYTLCVVPMQLEHHPAASERAVFEKLPPLDPSVAKAFDASVGRADLEENKIGRNDIRKAKRAAQRYGIAPQLFEGKYSVVFFGRNPPSYEKSVLYFMARIFQSGFRLKLNSETDAKLYKDVRRSVNVFIRRAALEEIMDPAKLQPNFALSEYLRRFKRQPRCQFWTYGFSPEDPDEHVREIFPGCEGLVSYSMSAILADLLRSSMEEKDANDDKEEGQLTQTERTIPPSILCDTPYHLADNWRVRLHPWMRRCFELLADHLEPVCRALHMIDEDQDFPVELVLDFDSKFEALQSTALVEEWTSDAINALPFEEPTELPDAPEDLVRRVDEEVFASLRKAQMSSAHDTRFHVMVAHPGVVDEKAEDEKAGIEVISLVAFGQNTCVELAKLPGN